MDRWTRTVLKWRWAVLGAWLVALGVSGVAAAGLADLLTNRFTLPGTDTARADAILEGHFGQTSVGSFTIVVTGDATRPRLLRVARQAGRAAVRELPTGKLAGTASPADGVATAQLVSELEPADAKLRVDEMRAALPERLPAGVDEILVTGQAAVEHDLDPVFAEDLKVGELFIAVPAALIILATVFGTLAFLVPFLFAAFAIPVTLGIIWIFANFMELTTYLQNMVMLIGLGIAIDYSLLVVHRYREEHVGGKSKEDAIARTMETAGRAVVFSGTAVAIGLALLLFMPLPFMRGFGVGGLVIPVISVLCALTLLPCMLWWLAAPLDRVRFVPARWVDRRDEDERGLWARLARAIMRRPRTFALSTTAVLLLATAPVLALELGPGSNQGIPQNLEAMRGLNVLTDAIGEGAIAPTELVVDTGRAGGGRDPEVQAAIGRLTAGLQHDPEVAAVVQGRGPQFVDRTGRYLRLQTTGESEYGTPPAMDYVDRLRDDIVPSAGFPAGVHVYAGGGPPSGVDFLDLTYGAFPWLVLGVLVVTYFLLMRAFRSLLLPLKAIVLNLLSIGAAYGLLVVVFKWGWGEWAGLLPYDQIEGWIPVMLFSMLFGLSMDYEVFLVSRMREEWDATHDNEHAVATGLAKTGRIVTAAGLVMFAAFMGFVAGSVVGLQQFGFGLAAAILIDVTIIRALLVPSAMALFGRWNWWLPPRVARVVRVPPSPLRQPARAGAMRASAR
jgi:RND superfamily putative drug exporter